MINVQHLWAAIRSRTTVVPTNVEVAPSRVIGGAAGPDPILPHRHYFAIVVNELFLEHSREWHREFDPVMLAITEFVYGRRTVTLPFVVGPKLLGSGADSIPVPQGMIHRNTRVAGLHPFRGGRVISTVVLCRLRRRDDARKLVGLVESMATAVPFGGELGTFIRLADSLLDGMDALFGVVETEPLVGVRREFDHDLADPIRPAYFALVDAPEADVPAARLWVRNGSLHVGDRADALQPFRAASYALFSTRGATKLTELDTLPLAETAESVIELAASPEDQDWERAKAELLVLYRQLLTTPDLTLEQAKSYYKDILQKAQEAHNTAKEVKSLAAKDKAALSDDTTDELRRATVLLKLD